MLNLSKLCFGMLLLFASKTAYPIDIPMYLGADGQLCKIHFEKNFGGNLFKKDIPGINPFIGFNLNRVFSIELGYQYFKASKSTTLYTGDIAAATPIPNPLAPITFHCSARLKGPHINLLVSTPVYEKIPLQCFCGAGVWNVKATFTRTTMQFDGEIGERKRVMEASNSLFRATAGANYFFNDRLAVRASVVFLNTKKLRPRCNDHMANHLFIPRVIPKNSVCYGLGIRWSF